MKGLQRKAKGNELAGKVVMVAGSPKGIGLEIADYLHKVGANIILDQSGLAQDGGQSSVCKDHSYARVCRDSSSDIDNCRSLVDRAIAMYGRIDVLVIDSRAYDTQGDVKTFGLTVKAGVLGAAYPLLAALPSIKRSKGSVIFIIAPPDAVSAQFGSEAMTEVAKKALAETLRTEVFQSGVHVGLVLVTGREQPNDQDSDSIGVTDTPVFPADTVGRKIVRLLHRRQHRITVQLVTPII